MKFIYESIKYIRKIFVALELWFITPAINFVLFLRRLYRGGCFIGNNTITGRALVFYGWALSILSLGSVRSSEFRLWIFSSDRDVDLKSTVDSPLDDIPLRRGEQPRSRRGAHIRRKNVANENANIKVKLIKRVFSVKMTSRERGRKIRPRG